MQKLTIFSFLILLFSCTKNATSTIPTTNNQSSGQTESKPVWPIVGGNYWVYRDSTFDDNGSFYSVFPSDTLKTIDSVTYQGYVFYGTDPSYISTPTYYRQADDSTIEEYDPEIFDPYIYFRQVKANNIIIRTKVVIVSNQPYTTTLTGYTDVTTMYGYDCIRNEITQTFLGTLDAKVIYYLKPGVGPVRLLYYKRNKTTGKLNVYFVRTLVSYRIK